MVLQGRVRVGGGGGAPQKNWIQTRASFTREIGADTGPEKISPAGAVPFERQPRGMCLCLGISKGTCDPVNRVTACVVVLGDHARV